MNFDMSYDGYIAAREWCEDNNIDIDELLEKEQSSDGYTLISLVNRLKEAQDAK